MDETAERQEIKYVIGLKKSQKVSKPSPDLRAYLEHPANILTTSVADGKQWYSKQSLAQALWLSRLPAWVDACLPGEWLSLDPEEPSDWMDAERALTFLKEYKREQPSKKVRVEALITTVNLIEAGKGYEYEDLLWSWGPTPDEIPDLTIPRPEDITEDYQKKVQAYLNDVTKTIAHRYDYQDRKARTDAYKTMTQYWDVNLYQRWEDGEDGRKPFISYVQGIEWWYLLIATVVLAKRWNLNPMSHRYAEELNVGQLDAFPPKELLEATSTCQWLMPQT